MKYICGNEELGLRPLMDTSEDFALLTKWLSNPDVCEYYEGKTKLYTLADVKEKFVVKAMDDDSQYVQVGIIQAEGKPIGFLQFYPTTIKEYEIDNYIGETKYSSPYGMDIVIGDTRYWNKGFGTEIMKKTMQFLFQQEGADIILIDPQIWNKRAIRCYEKCGFKPIFVAKSRELHDDEPIDCQIMAYIKGGQSMVTPYITFAGCCKQALELYEAAFNTKVKSSMPYGDYIPEGVVSPPKDLSQWILHAEMDLCGTPFWFADEIAEPVTAGTMVKLTAQVANAQEAQRIYDVLCVGAHITLPPTETFYSTFHAGLVDVYGVSWNITALEAPNQA